MITWTAVLIRLGLAACFGAMIGLERERKDWAAGLRTHMMVCVGACLTMMVSAYGFGDILGKPNIVLDPSRIAAQVISGIGFIGAGTILFLKQGIVRGLTTASGLWTVAAIGLATGGGMYFAAGITTILALIILWVLQPFEKRFSSRFIQKTIHITTTQAAAPGVILTDLLQLPETEVAAFNIERSDDKYFIDIKYKGIDKVQLSAIVSRLQANAAVEEVSWNN